MNSDHLPITALEDYRHDPELTDSPPDQTNFIFFDTPEAPMSQTLMTKYLCNKHFFKRNEYFTYIPHRHLQRGRKKLPGNSQQYLI